VDNNVVFRGVYAPKSLAKDDRSNLYLDADNTLTWPNVNDFTVNSFRAYFTLTGQSADGVRQTVLNFGDAADGISTTGATPRMADGWHTLDGRRLSGQPVRPGVYIRSGRKTVVGRIRSSAVLLQ